MKHKIILIILLPALIYSCKSKTEPKGSEFQSVVSSWLGKTIKFPSDLKPSVQGIMPYTKLFTPKPYKILVYVDSAGCTSCSLKLDLWKQYVEEVEAKMSDKVNFMFYFTPKKIDVVPDLLKYSNFRYPIYLDTDDQLNKLNEMPKQMIFQAFLLDSRDKVLIVGNPTLNTAVWDLYKKEITDGSTEKKTAYAIKTRADHLIANTNAN